MYILFKNIDLATEPSCTIFDNIQQQQQRNNKNASNHLTWK